MAKSRIGTDEAGKGDYFGYLVVAGVYVNPKTEKLLKYYGVRDSKRLSDNRIADIAKLIKKSCPYDIVKISPKRYNSLYAKLQNLNVLMAWAHARVIENLLLKVKCNLVVSDQFGDKKFLEDRLMNEGRKIKLVQKFKAESDIAVAAASILAREYFLKSLARLSVKHKMKLPRGATHVVAAGRDLVKEHGSDILDETAKKHFKTSNKILKP